MIKKNFSLLAVTIATAGIMSFPAYAQNIPSSTDAGRVQSDLERQFDRQIKIEAPEITSAPTVQAPAGAENIKFTLGGVDVEGADSFSQEKLASTYNEYVGQEVTLATVYDIANKITLRYRNKGYLLSRAIVPEQEITDGTVKIRVVEGFVDGYVIQGETRGARKQIEDYAQNLVKSGTLTAQKLERYLLLINDLPGVNARGVLAPSQTTAGGADLTIIVGQDPWEGFASVDNFGNSYLGELRGTAGFQINSLFGASDRITGTYLIAPDEGELNYFSLGYHQNILNNGTTVGVDVSHTITNPSLPSNLGGNLDPEGEASLIDFSLDHPFIRSRSLNILGGLGLEFSTNKTNYAPAFVALETQDDLRVLRANTTVTYLDGLAGYNLGNLTVSRGLEMFGSSKGGDADLSRALGEPDFLKVNLDASRLQRLFGPINILVGASGQWAHDPLLASEEFGIGGTEFGRGYDSSELTGDHGVAGKVELSYNNTVEKEYLNDYQVYTFYDIGSIWDKDPGAGVPVRSSLASVGVGTRLSFTDSIKGDAYLALPLVNGSTSRGNEADDVRFKFSLTSNF